MVFRLDRAKGDMGNEAAFLLGSVKAEKRFFCKRNHNHVGYKTVSPQDNARNFVPKRDLTRYDE